MLTCLFSQHACLELCNMQFYLMLTCFFSQHVIWIDVDMHFCATWMFELCNMKFYLMLTCTCDFNACWHAVFFQHACWLQSTWTLFPDAGNSKLGWPVSVAQPLDLWRVRFPPCLVRPGRRLPVQGLSEGSLGCLDKLPAWRGPGTLSQVNDPEPRLASTWRQVQA